MLPTTPEGALPRQKELVAGAIVLLAIAAVAVWRATDRETPAAVAPAPPPPVAMVGRKAPDFLLTKPASQEVSLKSLLNGGEALLWFFTPG